MRGTGRAGYSWKAAPAAVVATCLVILAFAAAHETTRHINGTAHLTSTDPAEHISPGENPKSSLGADHDRSLLRDPLTARTNECSGKPAALGTSRTIVVNPDEHNRIGSMSYAETLPLLDKEVVLTFDDGPISPYTEKVLDILASECVRATFFIVGRMAKVHPELVRRAADEGHTIGTHTMNHPLHFKALDQQRALQEIDVGIEAVTTAVGDPSKLEPFFRFPGFGRTEAAEEYLASRHIMVWGADFPADDWRRIGPGEVVRRALSRLEAKGKGILLLHDIHERTVEALPIIFEQLKERGFRVVHVVPSRQGLPAIETTAEA